MRQSRQSRPARVCTARRGLAAGTRHASRTRPAPRPHVAPSPRRPSPRPCLRPAPLPPPPCTGRPARARHTGHRLPRRRKASTVEKGLGGGDGLGGVGRNGCGGSGRARRPPPPGRPPPHPTAPRTTLLNHILSARHGYRIAVILNDLGAEAGIDRALLEGGRAGGGGGAAGGGPGGQPAGGGSAAVALEEWIELANGCVCCSAKSGFVAALEALMERRARFDYVLVETTGERGWVWSGGGAPGWVRCRWWAPRRAAPALTPPPTPCPGRGAPALLLPPCLPSSPPPP